MRFLKQIYKKEDKLGGRVGDGHGRKGWKKRDKLLRKHVNGTEELSVEEALFY